MKIRSFGIYILLLILLIVLSNSFYIIDPGFRGVQVTLGSMSNQFLKPGIGLKTPFITNIQTLDVRQDTKEVNAGCFSSDLQEINIKIKVLYRIPEESTVTILRDYAGYPFDNLIAPRVQEALKEVTALKTAADIVKTREQIKADALTKSRSKVGTILILQDLVIEDVALSKELENAIEAKMVQQQEAEKATFRQEQATTDAETSIIKAKGDAESIRIQGEALQKNPSLIQLKMVEKWNGVAPLVVGSGSNILLPMKALSPEKEDAAAP